METTLRQTAEAIAQHTDDVIEMSRLPLASMMSEVSDGIDDNKVPDRIRAVIRRQMRASPTLDTISFIDATGAMVASSAPSPQNMSYTDRPYFQFHQQRTFKLSVVGAPVKSRLSGVWVIPITQRVVRPDGEFAGVVVATIRINHFIDFFRKFDVGPDGAFLIIRGDGVVLARGPAQESLFGANVSQHELFTKELAGRTAGAYHYNSPVDGEDRAGGYYQSPRTGIVVLASAAERDVLYDWIKESQSRWVYACVLLAVIIVAGTLWWRQQSQRQRSDAIISAREAEFRLLAEASGDVISRFDEDGVREYVSPAASTILGYPPEQIVGKSVFAGLSTEAAAMVRAAADRLQSGSTHETVLTPHVKPSGEEVWLETALSKMPPSAGIPGSQIVGVTRDVTRQKKMHDELDSLAKTDELTGLSNRRVFSTRFDEMMKRSAASGSPMALLIIDADRFKLFNDRYGHAAGDDCLKSIAEVVRSCVQRTGDVAARYGGEEIAVLLNDTNEHGALLVASDIQKRVADLCIVHADNAPMNHATVSIGVAVYSPDLAPEKPAQSLFAEADEALYRAKTSGRNMVVRSAASSKL